MGWRDTLLAIVAIASVIAIPTTAPAARRDRGSHLDPRELSPVPSYARAVERAVIGIHVDVPPGRPSVATLGTDRWGSAVIFDGVAGYALTVSYVLLDAETVSATLRDGSRVSARLVGLDLEVGLGVIQLEGSGPWPAAALGDSSKVAAGDIAGTIGVSPDGDLVATAGRVDAVRPFAATWEYMLDRAFEVSPYNTAFGGGAVVDATGTVVGIISLRLGEAPYTNLVIPVEKFLPTMDELCDKGRVVSRRPQPWLGLYTVAGDRRVIVAGLSPAGPARTAGVRAGDVIVLVNGEPVRTPQEFYTQLWLGDVNQDVQLLVQRDSALEIITVRPADRYRVYRTSDR